MGKNKQLNVGEVYLDKNIIGRDGKPQKMIVTAVRHSINPITGEMESEYTSMPY